MYRSSFIGIKKVAKQKTKSLGPPCPLIMTGPIIQIIKVISIKYLMEKDKNN